MGIEKDFKVEKYPFYKDSSIEWIGEIPKFWKSEWNNRTNQPLFVGLKLTPSAKGNQ